MTINKNKIALTLIIPILGVVIYSSFEKVNNLVWALNRPNNEELITIEFPSPSQVHDLESDMDSDGNIYYTWRTVDGNHKSLYYQVFNKVGIPLTQASKFLETYSATNDYLSPKINVSDDNFIVTYIKKTGTNYSIELAGYDRTTYANVDFEVRVDNGPTLDQFTTIDTSKNNNNEFGVTFSACEGSCSYHNIYFQGISSSLDRSSASNVLINENVGSIEEHSPTIAFSGEHYLISYVDEDTNPSRAIMANSVNQDGSETLTPFIIDTTSDIGFPDLAGTFYDSQTTDPLNENFYLVYIFRNASTPAEVRVKKITCEADGSVPTPYACSTFSASGLPDHLLVNQSTNINPKINPKITLFQSPEKLIPSAESFYTIDHLNVAWMESDGGVDKVKLQNITNQLFKSGAETEVASNIEPTDHLSLSSNVDGSVNVNYRTLTQGESKIYPSTYLKIENEKLVNSSSASTEENARVAKNQDGEYVIVYQGYNGADFDIYYSIFDKDGSTILGATLANSTTANDQTDPKVAYFSDNSGFAVIWTDTDNNIYLTTFDNTGIPTSAENKINTKPSWEKNETDLTVAEAGHMAILYKEESSNNKNNIVLYYTNSVVEQRFNLTSSKDDYYSNPQVALSSFTENGNTISKFAASWNIGNNAEKVEGTITFTAPDILTLNIVSANPLTISNYNIDDLEAGYNSSNEFLNPPLDNFYYAYTSLNTSSDERNLVIKNFNNSFTESHKLETDDFTNVKIDPASQNIFTIGTKHIPYSDLINHEQILLLEANTPSTPSLGTNTLEDFTTTFNIDSIDSNNNYLKISSSSGNISNGQSFGTANTYTVAGARDAQVLYFSDDISANFTIGESIEGKTSGATADVVHITPSFIVIENIMGSFDVGERIKTKPPHDTITDIETAQNLEFLAENENQFSLGAFTTNTSHSASGYVLTIDDAYNFITVHQISGSFVATDNLYTLNPTHTIIEEPMEYVVGQYFRYQETETDQSPAPPLVEPSWIKSGPQFSVNSYSHYGQTFTTTDAAYDSSSTNIGGKFVVTAYSNNSSPDYLLPGTYSDNNGVYQQLLEDPFQIGAHNSVAPTADQEISPGGKFIVTPSTIDFGNVDRGSTETIDFASLNPPCLKIADLDGVNFNLTVSMTDLTDSSGTHNISNSNLIIQNNNQVNPLVKTLFPSSLATDIKLDTSTNPSEEANLSSVQTLVNKRLPDPSEVNKNTGAWEICPVLKFNVPEEASNGSYSGILTFTLI